MTHLTSRRHLLQSSLLAAGTTLGLSNSSLAEDTPDKHKLKITAVKTFLVETKLKRPFGVSVSVPLDKTRTALFVKIETDAGLVGWGETSPVQGARGAIDQELAPQLIGENPLDHRRLWKKIWGSNFGNAIAVSALDMALLDIRGKALNLPVAELFGGRLRDKVPAYASAMNYLEGEDPENHYAKEAAVLVQQGYKALKMRIGRYPVEREAKVIAQVRAAVGPAIRLLADGNAAYTVASALKMADHLHKHGFEAFEEPLPQATPKYPGYEDLRKRLPLSLAGGEAVDCRASAKDLIDRRCFDIIQPDTSLCGGFAELLFIAELAALAGIRCYPHCWGGAVIMAATAHAVSLLPDPHPGFPTDTPLLEMDQSENPWRTEIVTQPIQFQDGFVTVPTTPGWGVEVDEAALRRYLQH